MPRGAELDAEQRPVGGAHDHDVVHALLRVVLGAAHAPARAPGQFTRISRLVADASAPSCPAGNQPRAGGPDASCASPRSCSPSHGTTLRRAGPRGRSHPAASRRFTGLVGGWRTSFPGGWFAGRTWVRPPWVRRRPAGPGRGEAPVSTNMRARRRRTRGRSPLAKIPTAHMPRNSPAGRPAGHPG